jgi:hypothetical protein
MGANSFRVMHVDARNFPIYDTDDLNFFQKILNDIMNEYGSLGSLSANESEYLRVRLAAALFKCAEAGDRDYQRLKRSAIETVAAVPASDPDS